MGRILAVASQKGGVGKTTTAVNLAVAFARRGRRTLLIDADPQGSVAHGIGLRPGHPIEGLADALADGRRLDDLILPTPLPQLGVLLAGSVSESGDHSAYQQRAGERSRLSALLADAARRGEIVIVDTPPGLGSLVRRVLEASHHVLVPVQCEPLALQTTPQILRGLAEIVGYNDALTLDGILLTMYDEANPISGRVVDYVRDNLPPDMLLDVIIPRTAASIDATGAGQPVILRSPEDPAADAYRRLADLLLERYE